MSKSVPSGPTAEVAEDLMMNDVPVIELLTASSYDPLAALFHRIRGESSGFNGNHYKPIQVMLMNYINKVHHTLVCESLTMPTVLKSCVNSILDLKKGDANAQYAVISIATAKMYGGLEVSNCSQDQLEAQVLKMLLGNYQMFSAHLIHKDEAETSSSQTLNYGAYLASKKMFTAFHHAQDKLAIFDRSFLDQFSKWSLDHTEGTPIESETKAVIADKSVVPIMNGSFSVKTGPYTASGKLAFTFGPPTEATSFHVKRAVHSITDYIFTVLLTRTPANMLLLKDRARINSYVISLRETTNHIVLQFSVMQVLCMTFFHSMGAKEGFFVQMGEDQLPDGIVDEYSQSYDFPAVATPSESISKEFDKEEK